MIQLTITYDGNTIDLQAAGYTVLNEYLPNTDEGDTVTDQVDLCVVGTSVADVQAKIQAIARAFDYAAKHTKGPEAAYINYAPVLGVATWRSRLLAGRPLLSTGFYRKLRDFKGVFSIAFTRQPYWEGPETTAAISNPIGTDNTTGLRVYNPDLRYNASTISFDATGKKILDSGNGLIHFATGTTIHVFGSTSNNGTFTVATGGTAAFVVVSESLTDEAAGDSVTILGEPCNYVDIDGSDIEGDLPAAARIEMTNAYNDSNRLYNVYLWEQHSNDPAGVDLVLQGEDADYVNTETAYSSVLLSGGAGKRSTWTGDTATWIFSWILSSATLAKLAGHNYKVLLRVGDKVGLTNLKIQVRVNFPSGTPSTVVDQGPEVTLNNTNYLFEIGMVQLPPWLPGEDDCAPLDLYLYGRQTGGGNIHVDCIQLCSVDGYRILKPRGYGTGYNVKVVDDGFDKLIYTDGWAVAGKTGHYVGYGEQLMLHPNKDQRIYFAQTGDTADSDIARALDVKIVYRPRRQLV